MTKPILSWNASSIVLEDKKDLSDPRLVTSLTSDQTKNSKISHVKVLRKKLPSSKTVPDVSDTKIKSDERRLPDQERKDRSLDDVSKESRFNSNSLHFSEHLDHLDNADHFHRRIERKRKRKRRRRSLIRHRSFVLKKSFF